MAAYHAFAIRKVLRSFQLSCALLVKFSFFFSVSISIHIVNMIHNINGKSHRIVPRLFRVCLVNFFYSIRMKYFRPTLKYSRSIVNRDSTQSVVDNSIVFGILHKHDQIRRKRNKVFVCQRETECFYLIISFYIGRPRKKTRYKFCVELCFVLRIRFCFRPP